MADEKMGGVEPELREAGRAKGARSVTTDREIGEWVIQTCLLFGASLHTAYMVAGIFLKGLSDEKI